MNTPNWEAIGEAFARALPEPGTCGDRCTEGANRWVCNKQAGHRGMHGQKRQYGGGFDSTWQAGTTVVTDANGNDITFRYNEIATTIDRDYLPHFPR